MNVTRRRRRLDLERDWNVTGEPSPPPDDPDQLVRVARELCDDLRRRALMAAVTRPRRGTP